jgi:hypothetical protein
MYKKILIGPVAMEKLFWDVEQRQAVFTASSIMKFQSRRLLLSRP